MNNLSGTDWARVLPPVAMLDFRKKDLNIKGQSGQATLVNGFPAMTGKFSQGVYLGGQQYQTTNKANYLTFPRGTQISGNNYTNFNSNQGTISFWMKPYWNNTDGKRHEIFSSDGDGRFFISKLETNNLFIQFYNSGVSSLMYLLGNTYTFTAGTWYHFVIRWGISYGKMELFINNSLIATDNNRDTTTFSPSSNFIIGASSGYLLPAESILDDFAIWDRVLTDAEIADLYNSGTGKVASTYADSSLKLYLPFNTTSAYNGTGMGCSAGNMQTGNLVVDGNFENSGVGVAAWTQNAGGVRSWDTSNALFDGYCLKTICTTAGDGVYQVISGLTGLGAYHFEFWYKTNQQIEFMLDDNITGALYGNYVRADSTWTKFETEIKITAATNLRLYVKQYSATATTFYLDNVICVPNLVANGGFEGTYAGGIAPNWSNAGTPTSSEEGGIVHSGSKSQKVSSAGGADFIVQSMTINISKWHIHSAYGYVTSGNLESNLPGYGIIAFTTNSWVKRAQIKMSVGTSFAVYVGAPAGGTTGYVDDMFIYELSSVNITLTYLSQSDLFEFNGTETGITLSDHYLTIPTPAQLTRNGSILITFTPSSIYNDEDHNVLFEDSSNNIIIYFSYSTSKFRFYINGIIIESSNLLNSNSLFNTRRRIIVSWDFDNNIYELFENAVKKGGYYSSISSITLGATMYLGRASDLYKTPFISNIEKIVVFNKPLNQNQVIALDNYYEYAI